MNAQSLEMMDAKLTKRDTFCVHQNTCTLLKTKQLKLNDFSLFYSFEILLSDHRHNDLSAMLLRTMFP